MYAEILETTKLDSRTKIQYSLMSLMEQHCYSDITITHICQTAKASRQTFYRLFDVKDDVLLAELNRIMQEYKFSKTLLKGNTKIDFLHFFLFFQDIKNYWRNYTKIIICICYSMYCPDIVILLFMSRFSVSRTVMIMQPNSFPQHYVPY